MRVSILTADGIGDNADTDDDNDGYSDITEALGGSDPKDPSEYPWMIRT